MVQLILFELLLQYTKNEVFIIVLMEPRNEKITFLYVIITAVYAESRVEHPCKVFAG